MYNIVETLFEVESNYNFPEEWLLFFGYTSKESVAYLHWISSGEFYYGIDHLLAPTRDHVLYSNGNVLMANQDWTEATLYAFEPKLTDALLITWVYSYLVTRQTLQIHSSLVDFEGQGVQFLGPSGIGKTTQAELWHQYLGADIINGDRVFVHRNGDGFYGYGSPWHGSSPYCLNRKVKLKVLVVLKQAQENRIRRLNDFELLQEVADQVFYPHWYPEAMDACLETLDQLLTEVPVYLLECRPDEEAVQLVRQLL